MQPKRDRGYTIARQQHQIRLDEAVFEAIKKSRKPVTIDSLVRKLKLSKGAAWRAVKRLEKAERIVELTPFKSLGYGGAVAATYGLSMEPEDDAVRVRRLSALEAPPATRDPLVAAFFGEYERRAA